CYSCEECTYTLNQSTCSLVLLGTDINYSTQTCINDPKKFTDKTFDCQGFSISGSIPGSRGAIELFSPSEPRSNIRIQNCILNSSTRGIWFNGGIYAYNLSNVSLVNITSIGNSFNGLELQYINNLSVSDILVQNNSFGGTYISGVNGLNATNITAIGNRFGIMFGFVRDGNADQLFSYNNSEIGISLFTSTNNFTISNLESVDNREFGFRADSGYGYISVFTLNNAYLAAAPQFGNFVALAANGSVGNSFNNILIGSSANISISDSTRFTTGGQQFQISDRKGITTPTGLRLFQRIDFAKIPRDASLRGDITFQWSDADSALYNESRFKIIVYNGTIYSIMNNTPDTILNTISLSNFSTMFGSYSGVSGIIGVYEDNRNATNLSIVILNPITIAYNITSLQVLFTQNGALSCSYSIDSPIQTALIGCENFSLANLTEGQHKLTIFGRNIFDEQDSANVLFTIDTTPPTINIESPENRNYISDIQINYSIQDASNISSCWYILDEGLPITLLNCSNISISVLEGNHTITIYANDTLNNIANSSVSFTYNPTAPEIIITSPEPIFYNYSHIPVNYTATDPSGISFCWYILDAGSEIQIPGCTNLTLNLTEGQHNITIYSNDTANNTAYSSVSFVIDLTAPIVNIENPINGSLHNSTIMNLNYTILESIGPTTCGYILDLGSVVELPSCQNTTLFNLSQGSHTLVVYANDSAGNMNSSVVSFTIDSEPPIISIISPENTIYHQAEISINYTASDYNLDSCWYVFDYNESISLPNCDNITLAVPQGNHTLTLYANDSLGNTASSSVEFEMGSYCGDGTCDPGESYSSCPSDCQRPPPTHDECDSDSDCVEGDCCSNGDCVECDCSLDGECNPRCDSDPDCVIPTPCLTDSECIEGECCTNNVCSTCDCSSDSICNPRCDSDPDCCASDSECPEESCCVNSTCSTCDCSINGECNPRCPIDPDCIIPVIPNGTQTGGQQGGGITPGERSGCQYNNPPCSACYSCMNNLCIEISRSVQIDAPLESPLNSIVTVSVLAGSIGLEGVYINVTDPDDSQTSYVTDSEGQVHFLAEKEGYYTYAPLCEEIKVTSIMGTYVYDPAAPPQTKVLVLPLYLIEPSGMKMQVFSLNKPKQADLGIKDPANQIRNTTTTIEGTYETILQQIGKYLFTISATNVRSLSARIDLTVIPRTGPIWEEPQFLLLLLLIAIALILAYITREKIASLFSKKRVLKMSITPEELKSGQETILLFKDSSGKPLKNELISIFDESGESVELKTDEKGRIIFIPPKPGTYVISASPHSIAGNNKLEVL
ncbi:hypothetical protein KJ780_00910, partial [Candidatus Micrarchaeota archaeon]|nr:hypothetical protein [Candidatus Micrarchaeota archaeon]